MKQKILAILLAAALLCALAPLQAAAASPLEAIPATAALSIDGKAASCGAYNIQGANYVLPGDLAALLSGTNKRFDVVYGKDGSVAGLSAGKAYTGAPAGKGPQAGGPLPAELTTVELSVDGKTVCLDGYAVGGGVYLKLRDLARLLDFSIAWDAAARAVLVDTSEGYMAAKYANTYFDFTEEIAAFNAKSPSFTCPAAADIGVTVADEKGATGVVIVASSDPENKTDYYLNALVAGNKLLFEGRDVKSVSVSSGSGSTDIQVSGGKFEVTPRPINADEPEDEIITITKTDGSVCRIHTVNEYMPGMNVAIGSKKPQAGVYTFLVDDFMLRVSTEGNIVYYRNMELPGGNMAENFAAQDTPDGRFYTYMLELNAKRRGMGYVSGMYVIMDANYRELDYATLLPNDEANHTHGEGYLDEHEFVLLGRDHWLSLSYTAMKAGNLKTGGLEGGSAAYVQAGIIQEVKNGKVVNEYNTTDYPCLYEAARESANYAGSSDSSPSGYVDYAHINSIFVDPKDGNLLVSMRNQYAVYKINRATGDLMWALGGLMNSFSGLGDYYDANGNLFVAQHYARYMDSAIAGNDSTVTVFDNHTSYGGNTTRMFNIELDESRKTAAAEVINGSDLDKLTDKKHWSTHCGVYEVQAKGSAFMGWGSNIMLNMRAETIPTHALLTDYDTAENVVTFELSVERNSHYLNSSSPCFAYRAYKNSF